MRKVFKALSLLLMTALAVPAMAQETEEPALSYKSTRGTRTTDGQRFIQVYLKSSVANGTARMEVGDTTVYFDMVKAATLYNKKITVSQPVVDVKIYGKTISFVNINNNDAYDLVIGEDGKATIAEFRCEGDSIDTFDFVNDMKALTYLYTAKNNRVKKFNIKSDVLQRLALGAQPSIEEFTVDCPKLYEFKLTGNGHIKNWDLSKLTALQTVGFTTDSAMESLILPVKAEKLKTITVTLSKLKEINVTGYPALATLTLTSNKQLAQANISNCPALSSLNLSSNALKAFTLKDMPKLTTLQLTNNPLESLDLDLDTLKSLTMNGTPLKSVDLSKLPLLRTANLKDGVLESITLSDDALLNTLSSLYVTGNNFNMVNLPPRGVVMQPSKYTKAYNYYAPQKAPQIPTTIKVGDTVDLSGYLYGNKLKVDTINGVATYSKERVQVPSKLTWMTKFEEELEEGVDYTVKDGVFTFLKEQEDSVACFITNPEFDWFKKYSVTTTSGTTDYDYRLMTNYTTVSGAPNNTILSYKSARGLRDGDKNKYISMSLKSLTANNTAYIIIDGDTTAVSFAKAKTMVSPKVMITEKPSVDVQLVGDSIYFANISNQDATDLVIGDKGKEFLTEFWCQNNPISSLDFVSDLKNISYVNVAKNTGLKDVNIKNSSLEKLKMGAQPTVETLNVAAEKLYELDLSENNKITSIDLTDCPALQTLSFTKDSALTSLTLGKTDQLKKYTLSFTQLKSLSVKNMPALTTLSVYENHQLADLQIENCPVATSFILRANALKTFSLKDMPKLTSLTLSTNPLEELNLDLEALTTLTCKNVYMKSVDISKLPKVKSVYFNDGELEQITLSEEAMKNSLTNLYLTGNNFGLVDLPARGQKMLPMNKYSTPYNYYAPQKNPTIPEVLKVGDTVDLSKYLYGQKHIIDSVDGKAVVRDTIVKVPSKYTWMTKFEEELVEGKDYKVTDGVFTFLKEQEDSITCYITNEEFDWFKKYTGSNGIEYDYRIFTNYAVVEQATGIDGVADGTGAPVVRLAGNRQIAVENAAGRSVMVCDLAGRVVATASSAGGKTISVPAPGLYIIKVGDECLKMRIK